MAIPNAFKKMSEICRKKGFPLMKIGTERPGPLGTVITGGQAMTFNSNTIYSVELSKNDLLFTLKKDRMGNSSSFKLSRIS